MPTKRKRFSAAKEVRAIARERVGAVKPGKIIKPKTARNEKFKKAAEEGFREEEL